jgi:drug/metabolite transporter (DMT)-like permease
MMRETAPVTKSAPRDAGTDLAMPAFSARDFALLLLLALVWGNSFLFIKTAVAVVPPPWIVTIRMTLGTLLLFAIAITTRQRGPRDLRSVGVLALIGILGSALPWYGQAWAQQFLDSGLVAVLNACTPIATLMLAVLLGQERLYLNRVLGLTLAVTGTLIIVGLEIRAGRSTLALAMAVLSTLGYALAGVMTRAHVSGRIANVWAAAIQLGFGVLALGPFTWAMHGPPPSALPFAAAASLLALGLFGTGIAFLIFFSLLQRVGATNTSLVTYLVPLVGLVSGALVRGERYGANVFVGAVAMIGGVWLAQRAPRRSPSALS